MMGFVLMQRNTGGLAHLRHAPVRADEKSGPRLMALALVFVGDPRLLPRGHSGHLHAPERDGARCGGLIEQRLAMQRMVQTQRAWHAVLEDSQGQNLRLGVRRVAGLIVCDVPGEVMAADGHQQVV